MRRSTMTSMFWPRLSALTASWNTSGRYTETMQSRGGMAVPLSGPGRPLGGAHLVIPDGTELHVVAVLADALLALGTGAHRDSSSSVGRLDERRIIQASRRPAVTDCLFCRIVARQSPADIVYEDDAVLAFKDIYPKAPVHLLIVPKRHIASLMAARDDDANTLGRCLLAARAIGEAQGLAERGYRLRVNCGPEGGQVVYNVHVHFLAGGRVSGA